ncbi:MAG TPA: AraC family transcriptional regulator, partial [Candidatus Rifleibacterium sp.]|nr:AraC family transcriptional regulator [Candidatus Rifleibacterium sp.]
VLGEDNFTYNSESFLLAAIDLPAIIQINEASHEKPLLGMKLELDQRELSQLIIENRLPAPKPHQTSRGMATGEMTDQLLEAFKRLLDLLEQSQDIPIMA